MFIFSDESGRPIVPDGWLVYSPPRPARPPHATGQVPASPGPWRRFDHLIIDIGNAIARNLDALSSWSAKLTFVASLLVMAGFVALGFAEGVISGIIALFLSCVVGGITLICLNIVRFAFLAVLVVIRLIFWRGATFCLLLAAGLAIACVISQHS